MEMEEGPLWKEKSDQLQGSAGPPWGAQDSQEVAPSPVARLRTMARAALSESEVELSSLISKVVCVRRRKCQRAPRAKSTLRNAGRTHSS